jgi:hypothetical protein
MKKQLVIYFITILLIVIGLCGCNEQNNIITGDTSIKDINENSEKYLNKTLTVKGEYNSIPECVIDNNGKYLLLNFSNVINKSLLRQQSEYRFTGILSYGNPINQSSTFYYIYLEVIKFELA